MKHFLVVMAILVIAMGCSKNNPVATVEVEETEEPVVETPAPRQLIILDMVATPNEAMLGDQVCVLTHVLNTGDAKELVDLIYMVPETGQKITDQVEVAGVNSNVQTFNFLEPGNYNIEVMAMYAGGKTYKTYKEVTVMVTQPVAPYPQQ